MIESPELVAALEKTISDSVGAFRLERATPAAGGCIHRSYVLEGGGRKFFSKIDERSQSDSFAAESDGLEALAAAGIRVPAPLGREKTVLGRRFREKESSSRRRCRNCLPDTRRRRRFCTAICGAATPAFLRRVLRCFSIPPSTAETVKRISP